MRLKERRGRHKVLWGFIYAITFITVFAASAIIKQTYNPLGKEYTVDWNASIGTVHTDIAYGEGEANKFDLYLPADNSKENYGLVVYLHPGGFTSGDKSGDAEMLQWLCSRGYVTAGINYTLLSEQNPTASVYTMSQDIKKAMPVVSDEAERLGYKLDRMAISGGSAGGTLALLYAYRDAGTSPIPVKMVFEAVGPASFHHKDWTPYGLDQSDKAAANLFSAMSGNLITAEMIAENDYENEVRDISADMWIDEDSVPAVLAYGVHDKVCPFLSARPLVNALKENNVPYDYIEFPHSGHGLQNDNKLYLAYMKKVEECLNRYMDN